MYLCSVKMGIRETQISDNPATKLRLRKPCRLHHKSLAEPLFANGQSLYAYPLRLVWRLLSPAELEASFRPGIRVRIGKVQLLISVPKRKQKRAVDRVLMRRRIRDAFRHLLPEVEGEVRQKPEIATISIAVVYISQKLEPYDLVKRKLHTLLHRMLNSIDTPPI